MGLIAVHTGAGNFVNEENYKALCKKACRLANEVLDSGGKAIEGIKRSNKPRLETKHNHCDPSLITIEFNSGRNVD